jgi:hypothetical protein
VWIDQFKLMDDATQRQAISIALLAAAIGPALVGLSLVVGVLGALLSPIGLVALAVAGLAAAWITNAGDIQGKVLAAFDRIGEAIGRIRQRWETDGPVIQSETDKLVTAFQRFDKALTNRVVGDFKQVWETSILPALKEMQPWIEEHVMKPWRDFLALVGQAQAAVLAFYQLIGIKPIDLGGVSAAGALGAGAAALTLPAPGSGGGSGGLGGAEFNAPIVQITGTVNVRSDEDIRAIAAQAADAVLDALITSARMVEPRPPRFLPGNPF